MTTIRKSSCTEIFSFKRLKEINLTNTTLECTVYISKTTCPSEMYLFSGANKKRLAKGIICCYDYQVVELLKKSLIHNFTTASHLLRTGFGLSDFLLFDCTLYILLNPLKYVTRSIEIDWAWARRMWKVAAQADKKAFTGVYYSVLGGAFCSLGKQNAKYAYKAGELAIKQIQLAKELKDPILECKCWLYFAEDLIQLKKVKASSLIISRQKLFVETTQDSVLSSMLDSVDAKLKIALLNKKR